MPCKTCRDRTAGTVGESVLLKPHHIEVQTYLQQNHACLPCGALLSHLMMTPTVQIGTCTNAFVSVVGMPCKMKLRLAVKSSKRFSTHAPGGYVKLARREASFPPKLTWKLIDSGPCRIVNSLMRAPFRLACIFGGAYFFGPVWQPLLSSAPRPPHSGEMLLWSAYPDRRGRRHDAGLLLGHLQQLLLVWTGCVIHILGLSSRL